MARCLICNSPITSSNESEEHIIANAIGGKLKSKTLTCNVCNSSFGEKIDASLAKDLNVFANFLDIKRDRGKPQNVSGKAGKKYYDIEPGGKPVLKIPKIDVIETDDKAHLTINARDKKQLKEILSGLKRKYTQLDVDSIIQNVDYKREYLDEYVNLNFKFGGVDTFRSLVKTAYFFLKYKDRDSSFNSNPIVSFIKGESNFQDIFFFYPKTEIIEKPKDKIYHSIVIKSNPRKKTLVCYIELFNTVSVLVRLSDDFEDSIFYSYVFDIEERKEVTDAKINMPNFSPELLNKLFQNKPSFHKKLKKKFNAFLTVAMKHQNSKHISELTKRAMDKSLAKYPEGTLITKAMIDEFVNCLMEEITPFLVKNFKKQKAT